MAYEDKKNPAVSRAHAVTLSERGKLTVTVDVKNTGNRVGKEAVLLYSSDLVASIVPDNKRLRDFTKVELQPGEREVQVNIDGDEVTFRGLKAGAVAKVYGVNGVLISQHTAVAGQPLTVSIKNRPSGVYIVKADTESIKLMKK